MSPAAPKRAQKVGADEPSARRRQDAQPSTSAPNDQGQGDVSRVVYIGNLPHGFYERELLGFFSQFGKLTRVRLSRSKKTAKAKHYAFLEFQYPEVARIAADAMDGYFMLKQKLTCKVMRAEAIHPKLFVGANKRFRNVPWRKIERQRHDKERTPEEHARRMSRIVKKDVSRAKRIAEAGIDYVYTPVAAQIAPKSKKLKLSDD